MASYQPSDFYDRSCEVMDLYKEIIIPNGIVTYKKEATIYRKPNGEFHVEGACFLINEERKVRQNSWSSSIVRSRYIKIVTSSRSIVEFERRGRQEYRMITDGYKFGSLDSVQF